MSEHNSIVDSSSIFLQSNTFQANLDNRKSRSNKYLQKEDALENSNQEFTKVQFIIKPLPAAINFQIDIYTGLQITNDGIIRHFVSLSPIYFGFNQYESFQVEGLSNSYGLIKIKQYGKEKLTFSSNLYALQFLEHIPNIQHQLAKKGCLVDAVITLNMQTNILPNKLLLKLFSNKKKKKLIDSNKWACFFFNRLINKIEIQCLLTRQQGQVQSIKVQICKIRAIQNLTQTFQELIQRLFLNYTQRKINKSNAKKSRYIKLELSFIIKFKN
ncbi:hypothetical protein ABPG72_011018 [Tetrahymena utriculariae]